jgi:valyl-tRNA synthetase
VVSEDKIKLGAKLVTKLWNVARFSQRFLHDYNPGEETAQGEPPPRIDDQLSSADRWILSRLQHLVQRTTHSLDNYDYAAAKSGIENFFWGEFTDNYLEMCKQRLYGEDETQNQAAKFTLYTLLLTIIKLFSPFLPFITETIYQGLFTSQVNSQAGQFDSIHCSPWPIPNPRWEDDLAEQVGACLVEIAVSVRRFKSEKGLPLNTELPRIHISHQDLLVAAQLKRASDDLASITRAQEIAVDNNLDPLLILLLDTGQLKVTIES